MLSVKDCLNFSKLQTLVGWWCLNLKIPCYVVFPSLGRPWMIHQCFETNSLGCSVVNELINSLYAEKLVVGTRLWNLLSPLMNDLLYSIFILFNFCEVYLCLFYPCTGSCIQSAVMANGKQKLQSIIKWMTMTLTFLGSVAYKGNDRLIPLEMV